MLFSVKENIFQCLVAFQNIFWKIFSGVWLYSWKCSKKPNFIMFLTFFCIFLASKQIYHQLQKNPNSSKPKFSIPNQKKKIHQIRDQPKIREQQNKNHPRHHNNNKKIRDQREQVDWRRDRPRGGSTQSKQIGDSAGRSRVWRMVRRFLGSRWSVTNGFDDFWALLDERARSWVFWVCRSSWKWIDLAFVSVGVLVRSLFRALSLSLSSIFLGWKWFEVKMRTEIIFHPSQPYFTVKLKSFLVWPNFQ